MTSRPKALFLSPEAPYPTIGGGPLRSASVLEYLATRFDVHAIVFHQPGDPDPALAVPAGRIEKLDVLELPRHSKHPLARAARNSLRLLRNSPPLVDRFCGFARHIDTLLADHTYDAAVIEHFWCAPYLEQLRPHAKRIILNLHNIESEWHRSLAAVEGPPRSMALHRFANACLTLERKWLPEFDAILATSSPDAKLAREIAPSARLFVYPNALPQVVAPPRAGNDEIAFSGNLEYAPNIAAVRFFRERIWTILRERWPNLKWKIVGKNHEAIAGLVEDDPRIQRTGPVEDAVAALASAKVAVVPIVAGSGTRIKILEAWAAATPVASTTLGAEGLDYVDGEHLLIADEPEKFAAAVSLLLADPAARARIGSAGRRLYEQRYTWPSAWPTLDKILS